MFKKNVRLISRLQNACTQIKNRFLSHALVSFVQIIIEFNSHEGCSEMIAEFCTTLFAHIRLLRLMSCSLTVYDSSAMRLIA